MAYDVVLDIFSNPSLPIPELIAFVLFIITAGIVLVLAGRWIHHVAQKTKTTLDDKLVKALSMPVYLLVILIGFYVIVLKSPVFASLNGTVDKVMGAIWIVIGGWIFKNFGEAIISWYSEKSSADRPSIATAMSTAKLIWKVFVCIIALMMILSKFGIEIGPLLASLGIVGLAAALAFQETLQNFFAGLNITADKSIKIGDYIRVGTSEEGYVTAIGWRSTKIKESSGNELTIPNSKLAQAVVRNFHVPEKEYPIAVPLAVVYGSNLNFIEEVVIDVATKIQQHAKGAVRSFEPVVRYNTFDESGVKFNVIMQAEEFSAQYLIKHEFFKAIHRRFKKEGIEMAYPTRDIYIKGLAFNGAAAALKKAKAAKAVSEKASTSKKAKKSKKANPKAKRA